MRPTVDDVLKYLTDVYPRAGVSPKTLAAMKETLQDAPGLFLMEAARRHVQSSRWFPTVAELREQLQVVRERREALADVLCHERLAHYRQIAAERPCPPPRSARCLHLRIYYTDDELYQMEVARGTFPPPQVVAKRDEKLLRQAARLRREWELERELEVKG